jgi:predicted nucleic acid-binding protein
MNEVFADTSYFVALLGHDVDERQRALAATAARPDVVLVTTAWVLVELGNFLSRTQTRAAFVQVLQRLTADPTAIVVAPDVRLYDAGLRLYADRLDKNWSVTDCISFLAMRERRIVEALTTDHHFEQAGFVALLKQPA